MSDKSAILTLAAMVMGRVSVMFGGSVARRALLAVAGFFRRLWDASLLRQLLVAENPGAASALDGSLAGRMASWIGQFSNSRTSDSLGIIPDSLGRVLANIPNTSSRSFGIMLITFGLWSALSLNLAVIIGGIAVGAVLAAINRSFANMFATSALIRFGAGFFGHEDSSIAHRPQVVYHVFYGAVGSILGVLFSFLPFTAFIMAAGGLVGGVLVMYRTEVGVFAAALLIPIVPTVMILGICAITVVSYFTKILVVRRGRLPFVIGPLEMLAFLFAISLAYSILISYRPAGSFIMAATYILYILFFFAAKNTLRSKQMILAAVSLLAVSGLIVAAFGVYQRLTGQFVETAAWIDDEMFVQATRRIYSTLENPNVLGKYLIFVLAIAFGVLYYLKNPLHKFGTVGILGVATVCMLFTQSRGAWLGLLFAVAVFALMHDRRLLLLGIVGILVMPAFLPQTIIERFLSIGDLTDTSTNYRVNIWLASLLMIRTVWPSGIGPGEPSFRHVYQEFAFAAVEAPHSHNLFLQVIIDQGIIGFILLLLLILAFFKCLFVAYRRTRDVFIRVLAAALAAGMFGYLVMGMTDHVWYNYRVVAYFWFIMALAGALRALAANDATKDLGALPQTPQTFEKV